MLLVPSASPFEIYDASALSLHKKQSSTYNKYACGCFLCAPSICIVYFKRLTAKRLFRSGTDAAGSTQKRVRLRTRSPRMYRTYIRGRGCPWFYSEATFLLRKNSRPEVYTDVHFWTGYFKRLTKSYILRAATGKPQRIISDMDGGGSTQQRVCAANT